MLRPMTLADAEKLDALEKLCFSQPWPKGSFRSEWKNHLARYVVADENGILVGYGGMWIVLLEAQITSIAVHPAYRRQGMGTKILYWLMQRAWDELGIVQVTLETRVSNLPARGLYEKLGFVNEGIRPRYYENSEDAVIYWNRDTRNCLGIPMEKNVSPGLF
ncbi:MAG: ribosomal protein S18-alanine N-acetyltransferase [Christensenellales bacterium]